MNLQDLKKEIPYKWRVQSVNEYGANCVAYIDSRQVQDLLDEVVGVGKWQCKFEEHKNNMFCSIGIVCESINGKDTWVWKSDCGTESQVEKQKGEASDAFKRAAVMWGIGRFLYSKKILKIQEVGKDDRGRFYPTHNGKKIWDITRHCNSLISNTCPEPPQKKLPKLIKDSKEWNGALAKKSAIETLRKYFEITIEDEKIYMEFLNTKK